MLFNDRVLNAFAIGPRNPRNLGCRATVTPSGHVAQGEAPEKRSNGFSAALASTVCELDLPVPRRRAMIRPDLKRTTGYAAASLAEHDMTTLVSTRARRPPAEF